MNGMKKYHSWNVVISGREIQRKLKNHLERAVISEEKHFIPFVHAYAGILKYNSRTFHVLTGRVKVGRVTYVILLRELIEGARVFSWTLLDEEAKIFENKLDQMIIKNWMALLMKRLFLNLQRNKSKRKSMTLILMTRLVVQHLRFVMKNRSNQITLYSSWSDNMKSKIECVRLDLRIFDSYLIVQNGMLSLMRQRICLFIKTESRGSKGRRVCSVLNRQSQATQLRKLRGGEWKRHLAACLPGADG
ncbi:hypothetical protein QQ056_19700 [Oscillatoria laete-virens NRMC-F 0139]|nr:hypothetical protein [Oscillatoria laete-virens]MDL5055756.1 hypothetical protein [Oscillatoria laete-virens NRMC-F 0139]